MTKEVTSIHRTDITELKRKNEYNLEYNPKCSTNSTDTSNYPNIKETTKFTDKECNGGYSEKIDDDEYQVKDDLEGNEKEEITYDKQSEFEKWKGKQVKILTNLSSKFRKSKGLTMAHLNVRSLIPKIEQVAYILQTTQVDILSLNETWLDGTISNADLHIDGYEIIRADRNRAGGGVALYISNDINYHLRDDLFINGLEALWVEIQRDKISPILVSTMYRPPDKKEDYYDLIIDSLNKASLGNVDIILMGDLNYNYTIDLTLSNNPVKYLEDLFEMKQLVTSYTRVAPKSATTIDIILSTIAAQHKITGICKLTLSDHFMCYTIVEDKCIKKEHKTITFRDYKTFSTLSFIKELKEELGDLQILDSDTLQEKWERWKNTFLEVSNRHAPKKTCRVRTRHNPWVTSEIIKLMYRRDYLHDKAIKLKQDHIWSEYKKTRNLVNRTIKQNKFNYYKNVIKDNRGNSKQFWKEMSKIVPNKINANSIPKQMTAENLNIYFSTIGSSTAAENATENNAPPWKGPESIYSFKFVMIPEDMVSKLLNKLPPESNVDVLGFDSKLLKLSTEVIANDILNFINISLMSGEVLKDWKMARVTPVYKGKGDKLDTGNYRPISVICHIAKLLEKAACQQLLQYLTDHNFITIDQSAYLKNHSTQTSLHRVVDDWLESMNEGELIGVCFLDIKKCFDTINHKYLLQKLKKYGICDEELEWFTSYLRDRKQKVSCNGALSNEASIDIGVPQGSILGPFLFLLYANDLSNFVINGTCNCFADDTIIYVTGKTVQEVRQKLQSCINGVQQWYAQNRLVINVSKSNIMLLTTQQKRKYLDLNEFCIYYEGVKLEMTDQVKYLGLIIDSCLTWQAQISNTIRNAAPKLGLLKRLSKSLPFQLLEQIYKTYLLPVMEYGCTVWGVSCDENLTKIQKLQNLIARTVTGNYDFVNSRGIDIVEDLGWQSFIERRDFLICSLMYKCIHGTAPDYLLNNVTLAHEICERETRLNGALNVHLPHPKIEKYRNSFCYTGANLWNQLPNNIKESCTLEGFKRGYKKCLWHV